MFTVIHDAVRVAEREIYSARADAPVIVEVSRDRAPRFFTTRRSIGLRLHRLAEVVAPYRDQSDDSFGAESGNGSLGRAN